MALRLIYRCYGGDNQKGRPEFYDKKLALLSFIRAAQHGDASIVFLNDGPVPDDWLALMSDAGEVVQLPGLGLRGSYSTALELATSGRWDPADVVWFSEDDYLYLPEAFSRLAEGAAAIPDADYFALYASTPRHPTGPQDDPEPYRPSGWHLLPPWTVGDQAWVRVYTTTSTFGGRVRALKEDLGVFKFCMFPHRRWVGAWEVGLVLQGFPPFSYAALARQAIGLSTGTPRARLRAAVLSLKGLASNVRAHRRLSRRRLFVAADPNVATHLEDGWLSPGNDWAAVARDTAKWAEEQELVARG